MILCNYMASFFLIVLGLYCIVAKYDLIKTVIGLRRYSPDLHLRRAEPLQLLCGSDPAGPDAYKHRHRRLRDGHESLAGCQAEGDVWYG